MFWEIHVGHVIRSSIRLHDYARGDQSSGCSSRDRKTTHCLQTHPELRILITTTRSEKLKVLPVLVSNSSRHQDFQSTVWVKVVDSKYRISENHYAIVIRGIGSWEGWASPPDYKMYWHPTVHLVHPILIDRLTSHSSVIWLIRWRIYMSNLVSKKKGKEVTRLTQFLSID